MSEADHPKHAAPVHNLSMNAMKLIRAGAVFATVVALVGCSSAARDAPIGGDIIAPVTMSVNELQGAEVELMIGQMLNINTDSLAVDSYAGEVADTKIAEFVPGAERDGATFNPGVSALAKGSTEVTLTNEQGDISPVQFRVTVSTR